MRSLPKNWREIAERVNAEVNALPQIPEQQGRDEWKRAGPKGGDCEDLCLLKLNKLLEAGFPIERLRLATCTVGRTGASTSGSGHAVLVVEDRHEQWILDNLVPNIYPSNMLFVAGAIRESIQEIGGSQKWIKWEAA